MTFTIIGCGDTAKEWTPVGTTIGSNDCERFGKRVDYLVLVNAPHKFKERINVIKNSKAQVYVNSLGPWSKMFPQAKQIRLTPFTIRINKDLIYSSRTTPIICMSLAIKMGATKLILWGIDMLTHHSFRRGTKTGDHEITTYRKFFVQANKLGVDVYLGRQGTAFDNDLPIYEDASN